MGIHCKSILPSDASYKGLGQRFVYGYAPSELGELFIARDEAGALVYLGFNVDGGKGLPLKRAQGHLRGAEFVAGDVSELAEQIVKLWRGEAVDLELSLHGTEFQNDVWARLLNIPFGQTVSYGAVANDIARPRAVRAVGNAVGINPVSLLVPCHRVIQSNGSFNNYGWGNAMKRKLLEAEGVL